ncbi:MAG: toxin, partial [Myxococcales bacterium]|nr:toxin [Myxococcales bacterium]
MLTEQAGALYYKRGLGDGRFGPMRAVESIARGMSLQAGAQLMDLDGDGVKDLVRFDKPLAGFCERTSAPGWEPFRAFETVPNLDLDAPGVQMLDITGDGFADVLVDRGDHLLWWRSRGRAGFDGPTQVPKARDEARGVPTLVFADRRQSIVMADMTGDGMADVVRIRNGEVVYWPNLGYGRFGPRVVMRGAPVFDHPDQFRPDRVRTADVDGSGTTDLLYLGRDGTRVWFNEAGNSFAAPVVLRAFPEVGGLDSAQVLDLKGTGTACLVWSSPQYDGRAGRLRYVDLMGGTKPHLLVSAVNQMGRETRVQYAPSTKYYLEDRAAGRPWITKLPFVVHVLARVETFDRIARTKTVAHFRYHHGYYDAAEREFRGFGMVEQWDTESYEDFGGGGPGGGLFAFDPGDGPAMVEENLHQPPVYTKTWFHTGAWIGRGAISTAMAGEYWGGDPELGAANVLPDSVLPVGLSAVETREACRTLRGSVLRQEVYAQDGSAAEAVPYAVTERNFTIEPVQARAGARNAVLYAHDRETLAYHYERNAADPRVVHSVVLAVDAYGSPTQTVQAAYARRASQSPLPEQAVASFVGTLSSFANLDDEDAYRVGVPYETRTWELQPGTMSSPLSFAAMVSRFAAATVLPFEGGTPAAGEKRLLGVSRILYYTDDLAGAATLGTAGTRALVYEQRAAAFSEDQRDDVYGTNAGATVLQDEGGYVLADGLWWMRSGRPSYDADHFYLAASGQDAFGNVFATAYDAYDLLPITVSDPLGNVVAVEHDYRVLQPAMITDPNGNRTAVAFDALGVAVRTAVMGKVGGSDGDTLEDPTPQLDYDLFAYATSGTPNVIHEQAREQHGAANPRWVETYTYFDGTSRVAMVKAQAEPGLAPERDANGDLVLA